MRRSKRFTQSYRVSLIANKHSVPATTASTSESTRLIRGMATEQSQQLIHARPVLAAVDGTFNLTNAYRRQYCPGEFPEFFANLRLRISTLTIAFAVIAFCRHLPPIGKSDLNARRLQPRRESGHAWIFRHIYLMTKFGYHRVVQRRLIKFREIQSPPDNQCCRGMGKRIFRRKIINGILSAHICSKCESLHVDP